MFEKRVEDYLISDTLKIMILRLLKDRKCEIAVISGLKGEIGKCINNSFMYDKDNVAICICAKEDDSIINGIELLVHSINISNNEYIDNTDIEDYSYYLIKKGSFDTEEELKEVMFKILDDFIIEGSEYLVKFYKDNIQNISGCFNLTT